MCVCVCVWVDVWTCRGWMVSRCVWVCMDVGGFMDVWGLGWMVSRCVWVGVCMGVSGFMDVWGLGGW